MKKKIAFASLLLAGMMLGGCSFPMGGSTGGSSDLDNSTPDDSWQSGLDASCQHTDVNEDEICDGCEGSVVIPIDFYGVNDLHGKFLPNDSQNGVGGLTTYFKEAQRRNPNTVLLSSGDMWQGSSESNLTRGMIVNDWMSALGFASMTLGNHEFDWGTEAIAQNEELCAFPFLAINVYSHTTNERVDYCQPSVMIQRDGAKIGIIGAIGNCYSSISADKVQDVYFKTGEDLTNLVKAEATKLKEAGADCIVYSLHDDSSEYSVSLSGEYVDLVFEGHTHQSYVDTDSKGVYHLQGGGENRGITRAVTKVNVVKNTMSVEQARVVKNSEYQNKTPDSIVDTLQEKYANELAQGSRVLGYNERYRDSSELCRLAAQLYLETGLQRWGEQYNIVLGGGFFQARSPYDLQAGEVTYSDIQSIFPFDNPLVLCSISGNKLKSQFLNTSNSNYYVARSEYGASIESSIVGNETYYIVVDTYTSLYAPNGATEIARFDETTFARDLIAKYVQDGGMGAKPAPTPDAGALTSIPEAYAIGNALADNEATAQYYSVKGKIKEIHNEEWGNLTLEDEDGNTLYVYGLYDHQGYRYSEFTEVKPVAGDTIIVRGAIKRYVKEGAEPLIQIFEGNFVEKTCSAKTYQLTIIPEIYHLGEELADNAESDKIYYVKGKIVSIANDHYGNIYIEDENGYQLYIYGSHDENWVIYGEMAKKPQVGDVVVVKGTIKKYVNKSGAVTIEIIEATYIPYE